MKIARYDCCSNNNNNDNNNRPESKKPVKYDNHHNQIDQNELKKEKGIFHFSFVNSIITSGFMSKISIFFSIFEFSFIHSGN